MESLHSEGREAWTPGRLLDPPESSNNSKSNLVQNGKSSIKSKYIDNLLIWYANVDTLTDAKMNELKSRIKNEHPDVICLTEVYPKSFSIAPHDAFFDIDGYNPPLRNECNKLNRGVLMYTANHIIGTQISPATDFKESIWCKIKITNADENIIVGTVYRSPSSKGENNDNLVKLLNEISTIPHDHILINGDFNMKQIDWTTRTVRGLPEEIRIARNLPVTFKQKLFDTINDLFLSETVKQATRYRGTDKPSNLDWVLTENPDCMSNMNIDAPLGASDHSLIAYNYYCISKKDEADEINNYSFNSGNYEAMREELAETDWKFLDALDTQQSWNAIHSRLTGLIERHVPKKKYTTSKHPPWYGREIGNLSKDKKKAWKKNSKDPTPQNWSNYTHFRNKLAHSIERKKEEHENKLAADIKVNPKNFWKYVSSKTKSKGKIVELSDPQGTTTTDDLEKAEILNNHFASMFTNEDTTNIPDFKIENENLLMEEITISVEKLTNHLSGLNAGKASGPDGINGRILKENAHLLAPIFKQLFDKSLQEHTLPYQWKEANVVALFKKGKKKSPNNYRPVSLTAIVCKSMEKMIKDEMMKFLEENGLIHKDQHAFRGGRSCCTQLLEVMEVWTKWFDLGLPWDAIYTDFSKAFDSVPHERLLKKVEAYGIKGNLLGWIKDFLSERKQRVVVGGQMSSWKPVTSGIPQGSVLGPLLFSIFINDMPDLVNSMMKLFADDAKIFKAIESIEDIEMIQEDINKLLQWSLDWQLPLNISKCKCMHYGKKNPNHNYTMGGVPLSEGTSEVDVGVTFDAELEFRTHIKSMISKANSRVGIIKRSFSKLNKKSFKILYKSLVRPILEYCSVIWFPLNDTDANEIEKVQRRATKLVPQLRNDDYPERLRKLDLTTLQYRRERTDVLQVFRIIHQFDKIPFETFFKYSTADVGTRGHEWKLEKPRSTGTGKQRLNSFSHRVIDNWNKLPSGTVSCTTLNEFKTSLKDAWKNRQIKYVFPIPIKFSDQLRMHLFSRATET